MLITVKISEARLRIIQTPCEIFENLIYRIWKRERLIGLNIPWILYSNTFYTPAFHYRMY